MSDRKSLDRPASVTAAVLGVLLIGISAALFGAFVLGDEGEGETTYRVNWVESAHNDGTGSQGANGVPQEVPVGVVDAMVANITLTITCNDNRPGAGPAQAPAAQVTWTLTFNNVTLDSGDTCEDVDESYNITNHPDVAETSADSEAEARASLYGRDGSENQTGQAVLTYTWSRAQGGLPLGPAQATFTATLSVEVTEWNANVSEKPDEEASR